MPPELITAIGGIAGAGLNALSQHITNAQNRRQADYAFRQQQQAIQRQNEYNSPAQQVLRMKAAGLNPSLAYGADGSMVGNQADIPAYNAIPAEAPSIGNVGSTIADAIRTGVEVKDLERRQALAVADIALKDAQSFQATTSGDLNLASKEEILNLMGYKIDLMQSEINLNDINFAEVTQHIENLKAEKNEIESRINLNAQQIETLAAQAGLSSAQAYAILQRLPYEVAEMDANAAFAWQQTAVGQETVKQIARETQHIGWTEEFNRRQFNTDLKKWKVEQEKWNAELNQNRRIHMIDSFTSLLNFVNGAMLLKGSGYLPSVGKRAPITSSHHGAGALGSSPAPATNAAGQSLGRRYRVGSR